MLRLCTAGLDHMHKLETSLLSTTGCMQASSDAGFTATAAAIVTVQPCVSMVSWTCSRVPGCSAATNGY